MSISCPYHSFHVSYREAKRIQSELRSLVDVGRSFRPDNAPDYVGGVDVAFLTGCAVSIPDSVVNKQNAACLGLDCNRSAAIESADTIAVAGVVVFDVRRRCVVEKVSATAPVWFPYVPGYLSFREGPAVLKAIGELSGLPGVFMYDGCGIAHPRGLGLASHMSVLTGLASIGCAKSKLCGICEEPGVKKGSWTEILLDGVVVGSCLRTRDKVRPVYVSPGSGIDIDSARELVDFLAMGFRLPEPTRLAHNYVTARKKELENSRLACKG